MEFFFLMGGRKLPAVKSIGNHGEIGCIHSYTGFCVFPEVYADGKNVVRFFKYRLDHERKKDGPVQAVFEAFDSGHFITADDDQCFSMQHFGEKKSDQGVVVGKIAETNIGTEDTATYSNEMKRELFEPVVIIEMDIKMSF